MARKSLIMFMATMACVMILATGCQKQEPVQTEAPTTAPVETTVPETTEATEPTIPIPNVVEASAVMDGVPVVLGTLSRNDTVDIVDSFDEKHYVIKLDTGYGLVEKALVRLSDEGEYEVWTGYAKNKAKLFDNFRLTGEPVKQLSSNTKLEVLADLGWGYVVKLDDIVGYMATDSISKHRSTGGGGGGVSGGADGGDISLKHVQISLLSTLAPQQGTVTGQATVLANGVDVVLGYYDRNDKIPVVTEDGFAEPREGFCTVYLEGIYAYVPEKYVSSEGDATFEEWNGYSKRKAIIYKDMWLLGDAVDKLNINTNVHVLYELENCYFVEVDGVTGFMKKDMVSTTKNSTGGGSYGGGGGVEWTPPAL